MARKKTPEELRLERERGSKGFGGTSTIDDFVDDARRNNPTTILPQPQVTNQQRSLNQLNNDARMDEMVTSAKNQYQMSQLRNMTRPNLGFQGIGGPVRQGDFSAVPDFERHKEPITGGDMLRTAALTTGVGLGTTWFGSMIREHNRKSTNKWLNEIAGHPNSPINVSDPTIETTRRSWYNPRGLAPEAVPWMESGRKRRIPVYEYTDLNGNPIAQEEAIELAKQYEASEKGKKGKPGTPAREGGIVQRTGEFLRGKRTAAPEAEAPIEEIKPVESKAPEVKPVERSEPIGVEGEGPIEKPIKGQSEMFDMGPEPAPEPIYDKSTNPRDAWVQNQVDTYVNDKIAKNAEAGRTLTEAEIDNLRKARAQQWHQVKPEVLNKAMERELIKIGQTKGWAAAAAHHTANSLNPKTGKPFNEMEINAMGEALEMRAAGQAIRAGQGAKGEVKKPSSGASGASGARRAFVNPSAYGLGQGQFLNPEANIRALTRGGVGPTASRVGLLAMAPEMINQGIDTAQEHFINPRDAALDEAIGSPGPTSYDMASAVPGTMAGVGDFLGSLVDFTRPAQGGGVEFNTGIGANWYNPTIGSSIRLGDRLGIPPAISNPFGLPQKLEGATHPSLFSDMLPNIPGSSRGGSWGGLADEWRGAGAAVGGRVEEGLNRGKETLNDYVDSLIGGRTSITGGYAPPMAR